MFLILGFIASTLAAMLAYTLSRNFVTRRLRYVDAVQSALAPWAAGLAAATISLPLVAILPIVGIGTALSIGVAVGAGVANGARQVRGQITPY
ncbi:MAG: hypothetical protein H0W68_05440 [Gemmatimonadaceae bacterium]|nr:hypothetical protein [Gemmatimonadaceae bacterium]